MNYDIKNIFSGNINRIASITWTMEQRTSYQYR